jgi:hypothetical protein
MSEIRFTNSFLIHADSGHVRTGRVSLEASVPISLTDHAAACDALDRIKADLHKLIIQQDIDKQIAANGEALDPALITAKLPGVNIIDRRRGPRAGAKK